MQIAEDYSHSEFLIRLPGYSPSMFVQAHFWKLSLKFTFKYFFFLAFVCQPNSRDNALQTVFLSTAVFISASALLASD